MQFFLIVLCVAPSAWVNAEAQWHMGAGPSMIAAVIGFAFLAAIFTMAAARGFQRWNPLAGCLWGGMALIFIILNMTIALSGISAVREAVTDRRAMLQQQDGDRKVLEARLADLRKKVGDDPSTPAMIEARMRNLSGWRWNRENERLVAAREIYSLQSKIDGWKADTEPTPASIDPGIDNLIALVVAIFNVKLNERFLGAVLSGAFALLLELGADLGPVAIGTLTRRNVPNVPKRAAKRVTEPAETCRSVAEQGHAISTNVSQPAANVSRERAVEMWISGTFAAGSDRFCGTTEIAECYNPWASRRGYEQLSITSMGKVLRNLGYRKEASGKKRWIGLQPMPMKLKVVG